MFIAMLLSALTAPVQKPVVVASNASRQEGSYPNRTSAFEVRDLVETASAWEIDGGDDAKRASILDTLRARLPKDTELDVINNQIVIAQRELALKRQTEELARLITAFVEPKFVTPNQSIACPGSGGTLVVRGSVEQTAWIGAFLERQRAAVDTIEIETRFLVGPRGAFKQVAEGASKTFATKAGVDAAITGLETSLDVINAPRLLCFNLQSTSISCADEVAYVKEYQVRFVEPGPQQIADPIIETIQAGTFLNARAFELRDGYYGLVIDAKVVDVKRPIATKKVRISVAGMEEVEVGVPEITGIQFTAEVQIADGGAALFVTPRDETRDFALVVSVRRGERVLRRSPPPSAQGETPAEKK